LKQWKEDLISLFSEPQVFEELSQMLQRKKELELKL